MSAPKIRNVHERPIAADPEVVWDLVMAMSGPHGQLWPPGMPTMRFDRPLAVGAHGRHGPIHYTVTFLDPTAGNLVFGFREPTGLVGHHSFHVRPDGETGTVLRHEVIATPEGWMRLKWPLIVRWVHDAVLEEVLDRAEVATGTVPVQPHQRSLWVRGLLALGARRPRSTSMTTSIARGIAWALAASAAYVGFWAMAWPHSFFTTFPGLGQAWVAPLGPYNEHLVRDVGGLYVALVIFSGWAATTGDAGALRALGWAWLTFGLPHLAFHATHRQGFSTAEWAASIIPLTFASFGAAILVLLRSSGSATAGHPTPEKETSR